MFSIVFKGEQSISGSIFDQFPIPISIESDALREAEEIRSLFVSLTQRVDELSTASDSGLQTFGVTHEELEAMADRFPDVFRAIGDVDSETRSLLLDTTRAVDLALSILDLDAVAAGVPAEIIGEVGAALGSLIRLAGQVYEDTVGIFLKTRKVVVIIDGSGKPYTELSVYRSRLSPNHSRIVDFAQFSPETNKTNTVRLAIGSTWAFWACDATGNVSGEYKEVTITPKTGLMEVTLRVVDRQEAHCPVR